VRSCDRVHCSDSHDRAHCSDRTLRSDRGVSPVVGVVLLLVVTTVLAAGIGAFALGQRPPEPPPRASVGVAVDPATDSLTLAHRGGEPIPVADLRVRIAVDGEPLRHQPPVPFFAARGFESGPTGPLNPADEGVWRAGERSTLSLAGTNAPLIGPDSSVTVRLVVDGATIVERTVSA